MPIERDRAYRGMTTERLVAADRRARGEDRADDRASRPANRKDRRPRTPRTLVIGPVEASLEWKVRDAGQLVRVRPNRPTVSDLPRTATTRRVGRAGWKSRTRTPRSVSDPTTRQALDEVAWQETARTMTTTYAGQRATRNGTTRWTP